MNEATEQRSKPKWRWLRMLGTLIVCFAILAAAVAAVVVINRTEPTARKENSSRKSAALVETVTAKRGTYSPRLVVLGEVGAARDIVLSPRVSGQVTEISPKLVPGGMVRKGDLLLRIDPADFENAVSIRESELAQAEASREIEQARQRLAEKELKMLEGSIDGTNRSLVLREPQIESIEAEVSAAKAEVARATLDLDRTSVHAPFDAHVLSLSVNIGSQVGSGDELSRLVGLEEYWIMAAVPVRTLRWVQFPESDAVTENESSGTSGSRVILRNPDAWGPGVERDGRVARMIGTLDAQTRLARVLIIVNDPLGQKSDAPPLILDSLIETEIEGRPIENVVRLKRDFVRNQDTVWVMKDDKLEIRETEVVFRDVEYAYISKGVDSGDEVVTTTLATVAEGVGLRRTGGISSKEASAAKATSNDDPPDDAVEDQTSAGAPSTDDENSSAAVVDEPTAGDESLEESSVSKVAESPPLSSDNNTEQAVE
jgi:RND family efflux transporter MFP subunit